MIPMPRVSANGIEIEYETFGDPKAQPMLLIGGLGSQLLSWDEDFCALLAGHGFHVIRFDNRDSGLSTWVDDAYTLDDMAADAAGLLDALGIPAAHVLVARGRLERLGSVSVPTLVIHGDADILVPVENGRRVAAAVPGARLMEIEGMGHDLPRRVWSQVADAIASLAGEAAPAC